MNEWTESLKTPDWTWEDKDAYLQSIIIILLCILNIQWRVWNLLIDTQSESCLNCFKVKNYAVVGGSPCMLPVSTIIGYRETAIMANRASWRAVMHMHSLSENVWRAEGRAWEIERVWWEGGVRESGTRRRQGRLKATGCSEKTQEQG